MRPPHRLDQQRPPEWREGHPEHPQARLCRQSAEGCGGGGGDSRGGGAFLELQQQARAVAAGGRGYGELKATELALLVRYEFAARGAKGAGKVSGRVACTEHLNQLGAGAMASALEDPPRLQSCTDEDIADARLLLGGPRDDGWGDVCSKLEMHGLVPLPAPGWLEQALDPSTGSGQLTGRSILYNWGEAHGWAVGVLGEPNTSRAFRVNGVIANFRIKYECDGKTASHILALTGYASDATAEEWSWVLLGDQDAPLALTLAQPAAGAAPTPGPTPQVGKQRAVGGLGEVSNAEIRNLTPQEKAKLIAHLSADLLGTPGCSGVALDGL